MPMMPNVVPRHPIRLLEPDGRGSDNSVMINPKIGVKKRLAKNAHPKPMRRRLPNMPTKMLKRDPEANPNIINPIIFFLFFKGNY